MALRQRALKGWLLFQQLVEVVAVHQAQQAAHIPHELPGFRGTSGGRHHVDTTYPRIAEPGCHGNPRDIYIHLVAPVRIQTLRLDQNQPRAEVVKADQRVDTLSSGAS